MLLFGIALRANANQEIGVPAVPRPHRLEFIQPKILPNRFVNGRALSSFFTNIFLPCQPRRMLPSRFRRSTSHKSPEKRQRIELDPAHPIGSRTQNAHGQP